MSTYFVAGVAGFIGSYTAQLLLQQGHNVIGVDNINDAYDQRLKRWRLSELQSHENFQFFELDIADFSALQDVVKSVGDIDAIINLAARAGVRASLLNPSVYIDTNMLGTTQLLEICRHFNIPKLVLASTSSLYGEKNEVPYIESAPTDHPISPYAASKKGAEAMAYVYHQLFDIDITIFRYFTVYGPAGRPDMSVFRFIKWIYEEMPLTVYGDGQQSRDFTYVGDIAAGTIAGLKHVGYEIFNLGSDYPVILIDMIHKVEDKLGKKAQLVFEPRHPADVTATWANIEKAKRMLEWKPIISFDEGIQKSVEWYLENRDWAKDINT